MWLEIPLHGAAVVIEADCVPSPVATLTSMLLSVRFYPFFGFVLLFFILVCFVWLFWFGFFLLYLALFYFFILSLDFASSSVPISLIFVCFCFNSRHSFRPPTWLPPPPVPLFP